MHDRLVDVLSCPVCAGGLRTVERSLRCATGHTFDVARQGYVNLLVGAARAGTADTAAMVRSRNAVLDAGHYRPLTAALARLAGAVAGVLETVGADGTVVVDAGAGPGHHLVAVLDRLPDAVGLALDASKHAARRAARSHPRAGAAVCDLWEPLPVRTGTVSLLLDVFAPRNGPEYRRVLRPDGALVVVTPAVDHLTELVTRFGLLSVDDDKDDRLDRALVPHFHLDEREQLAFDLELSAADVEHVIAMGPSAWHTDPTQIRQRIATLPAPVHATASVTLSVYRPVVS